MPFDSLLEAEKRLGDSTPLTETEIQGLMEWVGTLSSGAIRRLDAESALQGLKAIRQFDKSSYKVATWGLAVNIALFILTIAAVLIAIISYQDASDTSRKQQATLDASKRALESATEVAEKQNALLMKSLDTAESQLNIIQEQYKSAQEKPDTIAFVVRPESLSLMVYNKSKFKVARDITFEVHLCNLTKSNEVHFQLLDSEVGSINALGPDVLTSPLALTFPTRQGSPPAAIHDELFGYVLVQCAECRQVHIYWVYLKFGLGGRYREGRWNQFDWRHFNKTTFTKGGALAFLFSKNTNSKSIENSELP